MSIYKISKRLELLADEERKLNSRYNDKFLDKLQHPWLNSIISKNKVNNKFKSLTNLNIINNNNNNRYSLSKIKYNIDNNNAKKRKVNNINKISINKLKIKKNNIFLNIKNEGESEPNNNINLLTHIINKKVNNNIISKQNNNYRITVSKSNINNEYNNKKLFSNDNSGIFNTEYDNKINNLNNNYSNNNSNYNLKLLKQKNINNNKVLKYIKYIIAYNNNIYFNKNINLFDLSYSYFLKENNIYNIKIKITNLKDILLKVVIEVKRSEYKIKESNYIIDNLYELIDLYRAQYKNDKFIIFLVFNNYDNKLITCRFINMISPYIYNIKELYTNISNIIFNSYLKLYSNNKEIINMINSKIKICLNKVKTKTEYLIAFIFLNINNISDHKIKQLLKKYKKYKFDNNIFSVKKYNLFDINTIKKNKNFIKLNINNNDFVFNIIDSLNYKYKLKQNTKNKIIKVNDLVS